MKRKEFISSACKLGICSCVPISLIPGSSIFPKSNENTENDETWKIGFMQKRFAKLIENLDSLDDDKKLEIIESIGRACAKENIDFIKAYKGDPEGSLKEITGKWAESTEYNKEKKFIRIVGKKKDSCGCPFVYNSLTPKEFCYCANGYFKEAYETILGNPVEVKIEESVLMGGERCTHLINIV